VLRRTVSGIMLILLLASMLMLAFNIQPVRASGTIYIRADGSIDPPTAPISTTDNVTYTLTGNITSDTDGIVIERNYITLDGSGYTLQGVKVKGSKGLSIPEGVTIKNMKIEDFDTGIYLFGSSNEISGNNIVGSGISAVDYGIFLDYSSNNNIIGNNITGSCVVFGIFVSYSSSNNIIGNNITCCSPMGAPCIQLWYSSNNNIIGNNIMPPLYFPVVCISLSYSSDNRIFHNNFVVGNYPPWSDYSANIWDDGYPSGGNYWSAYSGNDVYSGPYQNETGSDGIGDTPYVIDSDNWDNYPLMGPYVPFENQTIYIRADGSIDPTGAPILREGDIYTLTSNITSDANGIIIERDNMMLDGNGYTLQGSGTGTGIYLSGRENVTVRNTQIQAFRYGIVLTDSSNNSISGNTITTNGNGIAFSGSSNNNINGNTMTNNGECIMFSGSLNNSISVNTITNNWYGIAFSGSSTNSISGNTITANTYSGIGLSDSSNNNSISGNTITNNEYGVVLSGSSNNNSISGNSITANNVYGIYLSGSSNNNSLSVNSITNNGNDGIALMSSSGNSISGNNITNNDLHGIVLFYSSTNSISENNITNNDGDGIRLYSSSRYNSISGNNIIANALCGIRLVSSSTNSISENNVTNNDVYGIYLIYSSTNSICGNNVTNNDLHGIGLDFSSGNSICGNNVTNNDLHGIGLYDSSSYNSISGNNVTNNEYGIYLYGSSNNKFYHNNFINNGAQVYSEDSANVWDDGYPSGGNYWSDYTGVDMMSGPHQNETGSDGLGDTSYVIDENNTDNYPLMKPHPWASHDIGVTALISSKTVVGQGYSVSINGMLFNYGNETENLDIIVYANTTILTTFTSIALTGKNYAIITFTWNTSGFVKGNYTIWAYASPVEGETDTTDNTFVDGFVIVAMIGDITGPNGWPDGKCDIRDVARVAILFGVNYPDPKYNPNYDITGPIRGLADGKIDIRDVATVAKQFGKIDP
jgi:parallel beta-helix repeat protein